MRRHGGSSSSEQRETAGQGRGEPARPALQLTEEEKAVLMECRRNSTARGLAATAGSVVLLRALIGSGRVPLHVQRWSSIYYMSVGAVTFLAGLRSYRQTCLDKIMALEHSTLAEQLRQHQRRQQGWSDEDPRQSLPVQTPSPLTSLSPPSQPGTVASDRPFSSAGGSGTEQPEAFAALPSLPSPPSLSQTDTAPSIRGRTFDEIRNENRRRQQQRHYPQSNVGGVRGEDAIGKQVHVRRNKYGDIISEE